MNNDRCVRVNPVNITLNKMYSREFTDYRANNEMNNDISKFVSQHCGRKSNNNNNNSFDSHVCLQRNANYLFSYFRNELNNSLNLRQC